MSDQAHTTPKQKRQNRLTSRGVTTAKRGHHHDGAGLYLVVSGVASKKWVYRYTWNGRPTACGLGSARTVTLAQARGKTADARRLVTTGINPAKAKGAQQTFGQCAETLIAAKSPGWRSARHRQQWRETLERYAEPLWNLPVDQIDTAAVLKVLTPLWQRIPETASRLRGRIESVLDAARAMGRIPNDRANPARWRGHLDHLLSKRGKTSRGHHAAMPYVEVPAFVARLRGKGTTTTRALEFAILTAARSGEVLSAKWGEIDLDAKIWTIPAQRMKAGIEHRVPLSGQAMEILSELHKTESKLNLIFPTQNGMAMRGMALRRLMVEGATVHGMRSAFRDWCGDKTNFPREIAETALAHRTGDATERAYRRSDAMEKRRALMETWSGFVEGFGKNVIPFRA